MDEKTYRRLRSLSLKALRASGVEVTPQRFDERCKDLVVRRKRPLVSGEYVKAAQVLCYAVTGEWIEG